MRPLIDTASFSRPAGKSPVGKRTSRISFSTSELIEGLAKEEAKAQGLTVQRYVEKVVIKAVGSHLQTIVHEVPRAHNKTNCAIDGGGDEL